MHGALMVEKKKKQAALLLLVSAHVLFSWGGVK
jgi:hypothetical protein